MEQTALTTPVLEAAALDVASADTWRVRVRGVNWTVYSGEYWVIGGPHGSGKTDFLMTVAGLIQPGAGTMRIFGQNVTELSEADLLKLRTRTGFVFKGGGRMFSELTVAENVALPLRYHRDWTAEEAQSDVHAILELTGLTALARETAQTVGSDWQQRVGLARALALKPEILFLDEPATGLSARHRAWWLDFMWQLSTGARQIGGKKVTLIAATNDFALWSGREHRYGVIKDQQWRVIDHKAEALQIE